MPGIIFSPYFPLSRICQEGKQLTTRVFVIALAWIFALSGFAGLIYESIWSHYLKLFLGHAAYAQSLVLAIYMGGMALGAWIVARTSLRWHNLLLIYAAVEAIIGVSALVFHETFDSFVTWAYTYYLPGVVSASTIQVFKWVSAACLILPQTILLGMTFPLMTSGILRSVKKNKGRIISLFYFSNSIGAAIGVLVSGFLFIDWFGLPGTIKTAGMLNIIVALAVYLLLKVAKPVVTAAPVKTRVAQTPTQGKYTNILLLVALTTGMASFIYEVSWIRMLNLVLGSSTHAFEMMLSAFILGLALGGLWLRKRIDSIKDSSTFLAYVQLIMGGLALLTIPLYGSTFDLMQWVVNSTDRTEQGYVLFNLSSHALALMVMLPTTFCAGLTLPLITHSLVKVGHGEKSIGQVYAFNTLGAIVGVLLTIHILLPQLGLKNSLALGAAIDITTGLVILLFASSRKTLHFSPRKAAPGMITALLLVGLVSTVEFDSYKMSSGVYRHGEVFSPANAEVLFHQDGKTASVDLVRIKSNNEISIITNGKPDASINVTRGAVPSPDEATMVLLAALPMSFSANIKNAAVVGMGSGLTSHVLLTNPTLESVDTIEIESAIVEAAKGYKSRVANVFSHPYSFIHIEDAKTYFSTRNKKYDLIISEPSNPWVSGIATLFSQEYYSLVSNYLSANGIFAQWLQLYEIDMQLVASVIKAISSQFRNYSIYAANNHDIIIVASNEKNMGFPGNHIFAHPQLARELASIGVNHVQDIDLRKLGEKKVFDPFFSSYDIAANSDYYPVLDLRATKARFLRKDAMQLVTLRDDPVKSQSLLLQKQIPVEATKITPSRFFYPSDIAYAATLIRDFLQQGRATNDFQRLPAQLKQAVFQLKSNAMLCQSLAPANTLLEAVAAVSEIINPYLSGKELDQIWDSIMLSPCYNQLPATFQHSVEVNRAIANGDAATMSVVADQLLLDKQVRPGVQLLHTGMTGKLGLKQAQEAKESWETHSANVAQNPKSELLSRFLISQTTAAAIK